MSEVRNEPHSKAVTASKAVGISARVRTSPFFEATQRWG
jgi:hypothetical protein